MRWQFVNRHWQAEVACHQPPITQQWQPRVANNHLKCMSFKLWLALTTDMIECEQQMMTVGQLCWQSYLHFVIETRTPVLADEKHYGYKKSIMLTSTIMNNSSHQFAVQAVRQTKIYNTYIAP